MNKQLLSVITIISFAFFAMASKVNQLHYGAFNYAGNVEDKKEKRNYLEMNDGTRLYGKDIRWKSGLVVKDQIQIDGQKFKIDDVKGYREGQKYYGRLRNEYIQRIVHGKINVYVQFTQVTETSNDRGMMRTRSYTRTDQWAQIGDDSKMISVAGKKDIIRLVKDCPLAVEMIDKSNSKIRRSIRRNRNYLNEVFEVYNNGCKPLE